MICPWYKFGISKALGEKIEKRDKKHCVYCNIPLKGYYPGKGKNKATIEHINNNGPYDKEWNTCVCCNSCNASKGTKSLSDWLKKRGIREKDLAEVVKRFLRKTKKT